MKALFPLRGLLGGGRWSTPWGHGDEVGKSLRWRWRFSGWHFAPAAAPQPLAALGPRLNPRVLFINIVLGIIIVSGIFDYGMAVGEIDDAVSGSEVSHCTLSQSP